MAYSLLAGPNASHPRAPMSVTASSDVIPLVGAAAAMVAALATVVYTVGTFLLWKTTEKSIALTEQQITLANRRSRDLTWANLVDTHRELYSFILAHPTMRAEIEQGTGATGDDLLRNFLGTWLINHQSRLFSHHEHGDIDEKVWPGLVEDMREVFHWPVVNRRWKDVAAYQSPSFRDFVDGELLKSPSMISPQPSEALWVPSSFGKAVR
jgi:hypothetical protein